MLSRIFLKPTALLALLGYAASLYAGVGALILGSSYPLGDHMPLLRYLLYFMILPAFISLLDADTKRMFNQKASRTILHLLYSNWALMIAGFFAVALYGALNSSDGAEMSINLNLRTSLLGMAFFPIIYFLIWRSLAVRATDAKDQEAPRLGTRFELTNRSLYYLLVIVAAFLGLIANMPLADSIVIGTTGGLTLCYFLFAKWIPRRGST